MANLNDALMNALTILCKISLLLVSILISTVIPKPMKNYNHLNFLLPFKATRHKARIHPENVIFDHLLQANAHTE